MVNLTKIVQHELRMNMDYWQMVQDNITNNNYTLPYSFVLYLSKKYGILYEKIKFFEKQLLLPYISLSNNKQKHSLMLQKDTSNSF
jgi:hypothetical protein